MRILLFALLLFLNSFGESIHPNNPELMHSPGNQFVFIVGFKPKPGRTPVRGASVWEAVEGIKVLFLTPTKITGKSAVR